MIVLGPRPRCFLFLYHWFFRITCFKHGVAVHPGGGEAGGDIGRAKVLGFRDSLSCLEDTIWDEMTHGQEPDFVDI